jgi:predicted PurR-regulated permease PerM
MSIMKFDFTVKNLLIVLGVTIVTLLVIKLQTLVTIFAISFFIAYLFDPLVNWFAERNISRWITILMLYAIMLVISILFFGSIVPVMYQEIVHLSQALPAYSEKLFSLFDMLSEQFGIDIPLQDLQYAIMPYLQKFGISMLSSADDVVRSVNTVITMLLNIALIPIITFYFLKDFGAIKSSMFERFSTSSIDYPKHFMHFNLLLSRYFRGQVLVAIFLGVSYTIVLIIAGVKPALLLGMISGILSIVPYLGFIIGFSASLILSVAQYGDLLHPLMVIIGFAIVQAIESNIITPKIVGDTLGLHPTAVIFALMAGGSLMGIGGMIIALPVASFLKVVGDEYIKRRKLAAQKEVFDEEDDEY